MSGVIDLIDRASTDPSFLMELSCNPLAAARGAGLDVSHDQIRALLAVPDASDGQLAELLQARISYSSKTRPCSHNDFADGCSGVTSGGGPM
jgi:hypothetical protein